MTAIWINERHGSDDNDGLTPETALRTFQAVHKTISPGPQQDIIVYIGEDLQKDEQVHALQEVMIRQDLLIAELLHMCKLATLIYRLDPDKIAQERASWEREIEAMDALIEKAQGAL